MTTGINIHTGSAMPLNQANVDTDQIIPKQFLTAVTKSGYGKHLFTTGVTLINMNKCQTQTLC